MLTKCANPSCSTPFIYLREGKVFMIEYPAPTATDEAKGPTLFKPKGIGRVEHFWLCGPCSIQMTLSSDRQRGVTVVPKSKKMLRAVAS
ncbi:MAG TPA: hypothetical protein VKZ53_29285 [Candidatus Angelobacter sp.]|nr:hypothetical protein [Candidatus Angelobacter sp.]